MALARKAHKPGPAEEIRLSDIAKGKSRHEEYPATLDIVRIDGRWAQVSSASEDPWIPIIVNYLDDNASSNIDLSSYSLKKRYQVALRLAEEAGLRFTQTERDNVRWGDEQAEHPKLKLEVIVFGEYERKAQRSGGGSG